MPLLPQALQGILTPALIGAGCLGISTPQLVLGLSNGICPYLLTLTAKTTDVGTLGVGVGTGKAVVAPAPLIGALQSAAKAANLQGTHIPGLMTAIGNSVSTFVTTLGLITSAHPTVAVGTGIGQLVVPGPAPLLGLLLTSFTSVALIGSGVPPLCGAIANGIAQGLVSAQVTVVIAGTPVVPPAPSSGQGFGKLL